MTDRRARIRKILAATFGELPPDYADDSPPEMLPTWDSMNHIHLLVAIEAEFGATFELDEAMQLISVDAIDAALAKQSAA